MSTANATQATEETKAITIATPASTLAKLVAVFGVGASLSAKYSQKKVEYTDGKTTLAFDTNAENTPDGTKWGTYAVAIASETESTETFQEPAKAETKAGAKTGSTGGKQSPAYGYGQQRQLR